LNPLKEGIRGFKIIIRLCLKRGSPRPKGWGGPQ